MWIKKYELKKYGLKSWWEWKSYKRWKWYQRYMIIVCCMLLVGCSILLGGCSREEKQVFTISMMAEYFPSYEMADIGADSWLRSVEEETDKQLQIELVPTLEYVSTVERMIRNDRLPMVLTANETILARESFFAYLSAGGFWELDDYLDDYPQLKAFIGEETWENAKMQGHIYGIPRLRIRPRYAAYYRKDWADALGILPPRNLDEMYQMLKAFTENDPDGNGIADTVGMADSWQNWGTREWNGLQNITTALGGPNGWAYDAEKGQMVPDFSTETYMQTLRWFRQCYQEGVLDHTFSFLTAVQRQEMFISGQAGMIFGVIDDAPELEDRMRQINPQAEVAILPVIEAENGGELRVNSSAGYNGLIMFNRFGNGGIKDERELREILSFYNTLCGEEGQEILLFGREGEFHTLDEQGNKVLIYQEGNNRSLLSSAAGSYVQLMPTPPYIRTPVDSLLQREVYDCIEAREPYLVNDASYGVHSETYAVLGDRLNKRIQKASIRFIMGEITESDYWNEYQIWYEEGGKAVIEEYTEGYKEKRGIFE